MYPDSLEALRFLLQKRGVMQMTEFIPACFLIVVLFLATTTDILRQKIPNLLTFSAMGMALFYFSFLKGVSGFIFSFEGIVVGIAVMLLPYMMGGMGAGDAKLMGAVGGLLGAKGVFVAFLLTALIGGIYAMIVLAVHGCLRETLRRYWLILKTFFLVRKIIYIPASEREKLPRLKYGVAIALGTIISVLMKNNIYEMLNLN
jgi:prepilin peptidase CpaA